MRKISTVGQLAKSTAICPTLWSETFRPGTQRSENEPSEFSWPIGQLRRDLKFVSDAKATT